MIIPQDIIYFCHVYIYIPKYWQYSFTDICKACIYVNEHIVKIILWTCHHRTFVDLELRENSSPIVLIEIPTIVLKEGRSERGYNPETPIIFGITPKIVTLDDMPT